MLITVSHTSFNVFIVLCFILSSVLQSVCGVPTPKPKANHEHVQFLHDPAYPVNVYQHHQHLERTPGGGVVHVPVSHISSASSPEGDYRYSYNVTHPPPGFLPAQLQERAQVPTQQWSEGSLYAPVVLSGPDLIQQQQQQQQQTQQFQQALQIQQQQTAQQQLQNAQQEQILQQQAIQQQQQNQRAFQQQQQNQQAFQQQQQSIGQSQAPESLLQSVSYDSNGVQVQVLQQQQQDELPPGSIQDPAEREPEGRGIGIRIANQARGDRRIIFPDQQQQGTLSQRLLNSVSQYPGRITFTTGSDGIRRAQITPTSQQPSSIVGLSQYDSSVNTTSFNQILSSPPPIQVPYLTTPSPLQRILQQQRASQGTGSFSNTLLSSSNLRPQSLSVGNTGYSGIIRRPRVQNIVVPQFTGGQTPADTRLLVSNPSPTAQSISYSFSSSAPTALAPQQILSNNNYNTQTNPNFLNPALRAQLTRTNFVVNPSIANLGGIIVTPENQRTVGQFVFSDPTNPSSGLSRSGRKFTSDNQIIAASAQKIFILPSDDDNREAAQQDASSNNADPNSPAEIVFTLVDDDVNLSNLNANGTLSPNGDMNRVITDFSLFIVPSTFRKCSSGYLRSHDKKCRLVVKLRRKFNVG